MRASILAFVLLACVPAVTLAAGTTANLSWTHPTQNIDNTALPVASIKETLIIWKRPGSTVTAGTKRVAAPAASTTVAELWCGSYEFTAATVLVSGEQSNATAAVLYNTGIACKPRPPNAFAAS